MSTVENISLSDALTALKAAGVLVLPREATARKAAVGKVWSGKKPDGQLWTLTKNNDDNFTYTC